MCVYIYSILKNFFSWVQYIEEIKIFLDLFLELRKSIDAFDLDKQIEAKDILFSDKSNAQ